MYAMTVDEALKLSALLTQARTTLNEALNLIADCDVTAAPGDLGDVATDATMDARICRSSLANLSGELGCAFSRRLLERSEPETATLADARTSFDDEPGTRFA